VSDEEYEPLDLIEAYFERGWTDGLPVVPPTEKSIALMLAAAGLRGDEVIGEIRDRQVVVVAEKLAINAVMAGCRPEYLPVVIAAVRGLCHPDFAYHGPASSTGGSAMVLIVNGPIARELGINSGNNVFGQGARANATMGRAVRLLKSTGHGVASARVPAMPDEMTQQRRHHSEDQKDRSSRQSTSDRQEVGVAVQEPAAAEEHEIGDHDPGVGDKARGVVYRAFPHQPEGGEADHREGDRPHRRDHGTPEAPVDPHHQAGPLPGKGDRGQGDRVEDQEVFEEPQMHDEPRLLVVVQGRPLEVVVPEAREHEDGVLADGKQNTRSSQP